MTKVENYIEMLWKILQSDLGDMDDVKECFSALNIKYGVSYKSVTEPDDSEYEYCVDKFGGDMEDCFMDEINRIKIDYYCFQRYCQLFMDFSKMYGQNLVKFLRSEPIEIIESVNRLNAETRFSLTHK